MVLIKNTIIDFTIAKINNTFVKQNTSYVLLNLGILFQSLLGMLYFNFIFLIFKTSSYEKYLTI